MEYSENEEKELALKETALNLRAENSEAQGQFDDILREFKQLEK